MSFICAPCARSLRLPHRPWPESHGACEECGAVRACMDIPSSAMPRTVTVRIAVAVNPQAHWSATAYAGGGDRELREEVMGDVGPHASLHWVTATLPIPQPPEPTEVQGTVEQDDDA